RNGKGFTDVGGLLGVDFDDDARAVAMVDWDRDGDLDMWITNRTAPQVRLLKNNHPSANLSIAIRLIGNGRTTNRDAIGARLTLWQSSNPDRKQIRTVHAGDGFLSQSSAWSHFGLGGEAGDLRLTVTWPGGGIETFSKLNTGHRYTITQGRGQGGIKSQASSTGPDLVQKTTPEPADDVTTSGFWLANTVPFPELTYTNGKSGNRKTSEFLGKPLLINLWATWCPACVQELGVFGKHGDLIRSMGADVLALNVDGLAVDGGAESEAKIENVLSAAGYTLSHGVANQEGLAKIEILIEFLSSRRAPLSIPSSFLIDAKGNVAAVYLEAIEWNQLVADLALLEAPPAGKLKRASPRPGRWFADPRQIDRAAYLGDYATLFATRNFPGESQRLTRMLAPQDGSLSAGDHYNRAKTAARQGLTKEAVEHYRAALKLNPEYGQALTGLGALFLMQKRVGEAQVLFEKALRIDPNHATALVNLAMIEQSKGDKESALKRLQKVIARNPEYAEAHLNLGSLLASMQKHDEAIQHLLKAIKINPKRVVAHLSLATVYMKSQEWEKAEQRFRLVQQLSPGISYAHAGLGTLQARKNLHAEAVASYRQAITLGGGNAKIFTQLGLSLLALEDKEAASKALKAALQIEPENSAAKQALQGIE
ncbi:tetratricopeptide repeat protein, partial [bacterium]|nr:tetratricopeptide repeat protein [bacterium]